MAGAPNDPRPKPPPITSDPKPTGTTTKVPPPPSDNSLPLADNSLSPTIEGMKQADLGALSTAHGEATVLSLIHI